MVAIAVELHAWQYLPDFAVNSGIEISLATDGFKEFPVVSLAVLDEWSQQDDALAEVLAQEEVENLFFRVAHHLLAGDVGNSIGCAGIEQTQEVVNLRRSPHRASRVLVGRLLLDADDRTETCYLIDIGTFHASQEVTGVCAESLYVAALSFGIDGVESQRRLAAAAQACEYSKTVAGNLHIHILQVVDAGTFHANLLTIILLFRFRPRHF